MCAPLCGEVKTSTVQHPGAVIGVFTARNIAKGELHQKYYGTMIYTDMSGEFEKKKTYGEGITGVTVANFGKWALEMNKQIEDGAIGSLSVYIVPAMIFAMRFINDPRYKDVEEQKGAKGKGTDVKNANIHKTEESKGNNGHDFYDVSCMDMIALQSIYKG